MLPERNAAQSRLQVLLQGNHSNVAGDFSWGSRKNTLTAVSKKNPQDNQIQKGGLEDIYSGETLIQKSLPRSLRQVKGKRAEMKKTARILLLACML